MSNMLPLLGQLRRSRTRSAVAMCSRIWVSISQRRRSSRSSSRWRSAGSSARAGSLKPPRRRCLASTNPRFPPCCAAASPAFRLIDWSGLPPPLVRRWRSSYARVDTTAPNMMCGPMRHLPVWTELGEPPIGVAAKEGAEPEIRRSMTGNGPPGRGRSGGGRKPSLGHGGRSPLCCSRPAGSTG